MALEQEVSDFLVEGSIKKDGVFIFDYPPLDNSAIRAKLVLSPAGNKPVTYAEFTMFDDNSISVAIGEKNVSREMVSLGNLQTLELLVEVLKQKAIREAK
jgi:hypothetical protein